MPDDVPGLGLKSATYSTACFSGRHWNCDACDCPHHTEA